MREEKRLGLDAAEVLESRKEHGENKLSRAKRKSFFRQFLGNLGDPIIKILIAALVINLIFTFRNADWVETVGIAVRFAYLWLVDPTLRVRYPTHHSSLKTLHRRVFARRTDMGTGFRFPFNTGYQKKKDHTFV